MQVMPHGRKRSCMRTSWARENLKLINFPPRRSARVDGREEFGIAYVQFIRVYADDGAVEVMQSFQLEDELPVLDEVEILLVPVG